MQSMSHIVEYKKNIDQDIEEAFKYFKDEYHISGNKSLTNTKNYGNRISRASRGQIQDSKT